MDETRLMFQLNQYRGRSPSVHVFYERLDTFVNNLQDPLSVRGITALYQAMYWLCKMNGHDTAWLHRGHRVMQMALPSLGRITPDEVGKVELGMFLDPASVLDEVRALTFSGGE